jgi:hypothetical protein
LLKAFDFVEVKKIQSPCMAPVPMNYVFLLINLSLIYTEKLRQRDGYFWREIINDGKM